MQSYSMLAQAFWWEPVVVLTLGAAVIVGLATLLARCVRSAIWRRAIWQTTTLGVLALVLAELTGTGPGLARLGRAAIGRAVVQTEATGPADESSRSEQPESVEFDVIVPLTTVTDDLTFADEGRETEAESLFSDRPPFSVHPGISGRVPWAACPPLSGRQPPGTDKPSLAPLSSTFPGNLGRTLFPETPDYPSGGAWSLAQKTSDPFFTCEECSAIKTPDPFIDPFIAAGSRWPGVIWALGAVLITARIGWAQVLLCAFRRRLSASGDGALCQKTDELARRLGLRRPVCIWKADGLRVPVAFGVFRPTIALPAGFGEDFDRPRQEAILVHELAHLAGRDPAWQLLADLLCAALWWHPAVWWLQRRLHMANEAAADEASLLLPDGPGLLAGCLVVLGAQIVGRRLGWLSARGSGFRSSLGRRVETLLSLRARSWRAPGRGWMMFAKTALPIVLVVLAVLCTAWVRPRAALAEGETTMNVLEVSWRRSLAAMALVAFLGPASGDAVSDDLPVDQPVADAGFSDEALLFAERDADRERDEAEEREKPEAKRPDRDEGERRERTEDEKPERRDAGEHRRDHDRRDPPPEALMRERRELEERGREIRRQLEQLPEGQTDKAHRLKAALEEIHVRIRQISERFRGPERERRRRDAERLHREEVERRIHELRQEHRELEERAGDIERRARELGDDRPDEAQKLRREHEEIRHRAEQIEREVRELHGERPLGHRPHPGEGEELERRLHHLRVAAENLHAAGLHEQAERLMHEVERIEAEHAERGRRRPEPPRDRERPERPPHPEQFERVIHELRGEVHQLHREMEELRHQLRKLLERRPDRDRDRDRHPDRERDRAPDRDPEPERDEK